MALSTYDLLYTKELHYGHKIIFVTFHSKEFMFRTLSRKEYKDIINISKEELDLEDIICQTSLLYPEDYSFSTSPFCGIASTVAPLILDYSGFTNLDNITEMYDQAKEKMKMFDQQCMAMVKICFNDYRYEEMEDWTWEQLIEMATRAEYMLQLKGEDISLVNKTEEVKEHAQSQEQGEFTLKERDEFILELRKKGIDPMFYFKDSIFSKKKYNELPTIGGVYWNDEGVIYEIRKQMEKRKAR